MICIGTSGFSYDDWKGHFYPEKITKKDMLTYYAQSFDCVEINSTYYTIPSLSSFVGMDRKTPPGFKFAVKAHKDMTHAECPDPTAFKRFFQAIEPIKASEKLGCVLAQFPWSFKYGDRNIDRLRDMKDIVGDVPTVVEFRNAGWVNDETFALLRELNLGFCCVDEPHLKGLMPPIAAVTADVGYVRFHGRNAKKWWKHESANERYDYLYPPEELAEWIPRVREISHSAKTTYVFFNNHYRGKSARNAKMFATMLGLTLPTKDVEAFLQGQRQMTFGE